MFHHRHKFNMGVSHLLHIFYDLRRQFPVSIKFSAVLRLIKRSQIKFIDTHGLILCLPLRTVFHPLAVLPGKPVQISDHRGTSRTQLCPKTVRICFHKGKPAFCLNLKFVAFPVFHVRNKQLKNAGVPESSHLVHPSVPAVKIPHHADPQGIGCPDCKISSLCIINFHRVGAQFLIDHIMNAGIEFLCILSGNLGRKIVSVLHLPQTAVLRFHNILVGGNCLTWQKQGKIPLLIRLLHLITLIS